MATRAQESTDQNRPTPKDVRAPNPNQAPSPVTPATPVASESFKAQIRARLPKLTDDELNRLASNQQGAQKVLLTVNSGASNDDVQKEVDAVLGVKH